MDILDMKMRKKIVCQISSPRQGREYPRTKVKLLVGSIDWHLCGCESQHGRWEHLHPAPTPHTDNGKDAGRGHGGGANHIERLGKLPLNRTSR
jgi:hypothetical protein